MNARRGRPTSPDVVGRASRTRCPSCGTEVFFSRYVPAPERMRPGKRSRLLLDVVPSDPGDEFAQYAVDGPLGGRCRRITEEDPIDLPVERRHTHHYATHPECKPTTPPSSTDPA